VALFPALGIGAGMVYGSGTGAGLGAIAGHAVGGMSRSDLRDLGETLDSGGAALVAVAAAAFADRVQARIEHAEKLERNKIKADTQAMEKDAKVSEATVPSQRSECASTPQTTKS